MDSTTKNHTICLSRKKTYKPILSQERYEEVLTWLCEYALIHDYARLIKMISTANPTIVSRSSDHALILKSFLYRVKVSGPLPKISSPEFTFTLLKGVEAFLKEQNSWIHEFDLAAPIDEDMLMNGLFQLTLLALIRSKKYDKRDVEQMLGLLPTYLKTGSNKISICQGLSLEDQIHSMLQNCPSRAELERQELEVWENMSPELWRLLSCIELHIADPVLDRLVVPSGVARHWLGYVITGIGDKTERQLCMFLRQLNNCRYESAFWLSYPI